MEAEVGYEKRKKDLQSINREILDRLKCNIPKRIEPDKKGMIFLLHKDWNLVINMMIGINKSVRALWDVDDHHVVESDFEMRDMFELKYRRTFGGNFDDIKGNCVFVDYAPYVFGKIRRKYDIKSEDYLASIGSESLISSLIKGEITTFYELFSSGKSGNFFFYSMDGKYILRTLNRDEFKFLK